MTDHTPEPLNPSYLLLGEILRPHGVTGEIRMRLLTAYPERLRTLKTVYLARKPDSTTPRPFAITSVRFHQQYALVRFEGVPDRDAADRLRGLFVLIDVANAVPLEEGEFYLYQLLGLHVVTDDGRTLGTLTEVLETGANDVYVVRGEPYGEVLIPVTPDTIVKTDIAARVLTVKLPEGLLPEQTPDVRDEG
jgi:16S rRNA processing protein RimM